MVPAQAVQLRVALREGGICFYVTHGFKSSVEKLKENVLTSLSHLDANILNIHFDLLRFTVNN